MEYRTLRGTDLEMSVITFGTIWFAAAPNRPQVDSDAGKEAMNLALDMGVNTIHSSYEYQTRHVIAEVLKGRGDAKELKHIIKVPSPDREKTDGVFSAAYFRKLIEDALAEMGCERIDLLQWILRNGSEADSELCIPAWNEYKDDLMAVFEKMRDEGKVGYLGNFVYAEPYADTVADSGCLSALLFYYNMWDTTIQGSFDRLEELDMGAVVLRPFHGGMLTTKRADRHNLPEGDKFESEKRQALLERRDRLFAEVGLDVGNLTEMAVKFCLSQPNIASLITGLNTAEQVKEVLGYVDGDYPAKSLANDLRDAADKLGFHGEM